MSPELKPNRKYEHLYAIVRYELDRDESVPIELRVTVKKVVTDPNFAAAEVQRLNSLNQDKKCRYFYQVTRFEESPTDGISMPKIAVESPVDSSTIAR